MRWRDLILMDIMDEGGGNPPVPPSRPGDPPRPRKITCEFCECELGASGEYKRLSDKAKGYRDSEEKIERLQTEITSVRAELAAARQAVPLEPRRESRSGGITL